MYSIGIDIGGTGIKTCVMSAEGVVLQKSVMPTVPEKGYALMVGDMAREAERLLFEANVPLSEVAGLGVGIPGLADSAAGIVRLAINLRWKDVLLSSEFQKYFPLPVKLSNDANCAALGEQRFGAGAAFKDMVFITLGTGVGSGIIVHGEILEGHGSAGGESGHMVIVFDGERCPCGRRGCWEQYASATALIRQTAEAIKKYPESLMARIAQEEKKVSGKTAFRAADMGDVEAKKVTEKYIKYVAAGLINLTNILHPEAFVIGGGVSKEGNNLIIPLQNEVDEFIETSGMFPAVKVVRASLGSDAGMIGAASLVL